MGPSEPWAAGAHVAAKIGPDAWSVELALPIQSLGEQAAANLVWGISVTRLDSRRGEYSSWSAARGNCYSPQALGNLVLLGP
jgi:hypothetical protein